MRKPRDEDVVAAVEELFTDGLELQWCVGETVEQHEHSRRSSVVCEESRAVVGRNDAVVASLSARDERNGLRVVGWDREWRRCQSRRSAGGEREEKKSQSPPELSCPSHGERRVPAGAHVKKGRGAAQALLSLAETSVFHSLIVPEQVPKYI